MAGEGFSHPELEKLAPEARAKVQSALKATLEQQLAGGAVSAGGVGPVAAHDRSKTAFFSRSKTTDVLRTGDDVMAQQVSQLDDAAFENFATRLSRLKQVANPEG